MTSQLVLALLPAAGAGVGYYYLHKRKHRDATGSMLVGFIAGSAVAALLQYTSLGQIVNFRAATFQSAGAYQPLVVSGRQNNGTLLF